MPIVLMQAVSQPSPFTKLREKTRSLSKTVHSNFFYSFLFLPKEKREAIIDVYGFCREIDDIVDDSATQNPQLELQRWRHELDNLYAGNPQWTQTIKLQKTLEKFPIPKELFLKLVHGCEFDLVRNRYQTFDELSEYCYHVASVVGLMCIEIFTYHSSVTKDYAVNLGMALQLTNIIRDVGEDAARNRIYLPQEDLRRFNYSEAELMNNTINQAFHDLMKFQWERALSYYQQAEKCFPEADRATLTASRTMSKIYYQLFEQIKAANYDVFHHHVSLPMNQRFRIALKEWYGGRS